MSATVLKTLVVGGTGFIGMPLVRLLCADGRRSVIVAGRRPHAPADLPSSARYISIDAADGEALLSVLEDMDEVVDLAYATVPQTSFDDPVHDVLANLPATVNLLKKASEVSLRRFLFVSSGGTVYGNANSLPIDEDHPTNPVSPYGITKLAAEKYGFMYWRSKGLPFIAVRPSNPYGPGQLGGRGQGFVATAMQQALDGSPITIFGERGTIRDYIYVDDLVRGIVAALEHATVGSVLNIGTGIGIDNRQMLDVISMVLEGDGVPVEIRTAPARAFDVSANVLDSTKLRRLSGWSPVTSLEDGVRNAWGWNKRRQL